MYVYERGPYFWCTIKKEELKNQNENEKSPNFVLNSIMLCQDTQTFMVIQLKNMEWATFSFTIGEEYFMQ
mgnify:CR=1 FL=1